MKVYLDYAATTPVRDEVVTAMLPYFNQAFGNASSVYSCGQEARDAVESARVKVAGLINVKPEEIFFTCGGTEADNFALKGIAFANEKKGNHIISCSIEHHAILESLKSLEKRGFSVTFVPVDQCGLVNPDDIKKAISSKTILISIMHANNEIGTIEPINEIGKIARETNVYFHTDAVQTAGHIPVDTREMSVDLLSISAHKLYGPKGVGALYIRKGTKILPFIDGGAQENRRRAGTENVPGIVGFGVAAELIQSEIEPEAERQIILRNRLIEGVQANLDFVKLNGHSKLRLPNNVNVSIDFIEGESMCLSLDFQGICASTGSACSSASLEPSHVLLAIGLLPEQAHSSLRFTLGRWNTEEDITYVLDVLPKVVKKLRAMSPLAKK